MSGLSSKEVKHVAKLANLVLSESEVKVFTKQLQDVLEYMKQLEGVDTKGVKPTYQVLDGTENVFRGDKVEKSFTQEEALSQAERKNNGYFVAEHVFSEKKCIGKRKTVKRKQIDKNNAILTEVDNKGTVGHKDLFMTKGIETTAGSAVLNSYKAQYSSTVVKILEKEGLKTKYKLNQDAWGHGASGENSDFGPTTNPWDFTRVAGGSSSGSGAVVALGKVDLATGTDTGGSIRMPASFCNTTSLKPTYGSLSRYGVIAFASSLDCPSIMTKSTSKLRKYYKLLNKRDELDASSQSVQRAKVKSKKPKVIGLPKEYFSKSNNPEILKALKMAIESFEKMGLDIKEVSLPHSMLGVSVYYIIAPTETSSNLARYTGIRYGNTREYFGDEARRRIMLGTYTSSAGYSRRYYEKASRVRTLIIRDFEQVFSRVDVLITPASPTPPFKIGEKSNDPLQMYLMDIYMSAISLTGLPSLTLPCGFTKDNLPIGMQIVGPRWNEEMLFDLGEKYQGITDWHKRSPESN